MLPIYYQFRREMMRFAVVAETLNFSRAADMLGERQSQISKSMLALEKELQMKLFARGSRGVVLTDAGQTLHTAVMQQKKFWESYLLERGSNAEPLQVGCHSAVGMIVIPHFLHRLVGEQLVKRFEISLKPSLEVCHDVLAGRLDIGFVANPLQHPSLIAKKMFSERASIYYQGEVAGIRFLYFHPEMIMVNKHLKKFAPSVQKVALSDYEVIAQTVLNNKDAAAILPETVGQRNKLIARGRPVFETIVHMIAVRESLQNRVIKSVFKEARKFERD